MTVADIVTDEYRWTYLAGSRLASRNEWLPAVKVYARARLHLDAITDALAAAADDNGCLFDYSPNEFYRRHLTDALRNDTDPPDWELRYDTFAAMTLTDAMSELLGAGYLAHRSTADPRGYRLAVPSST